MHLFPQPTPRSDAYTTWTSLCKAQLPALARSASTHQPHWAIYSDHCFARIILDAVVGTDRRDEQHMNESQLEQCIALALGIADGTVNLTELDQRSRETRERKRKRIDGAVDVEVEKNKNNNNNNKPTTTRKKKKKTTHQLDIRTLISPSPLPSTTTATTTTTTPPPPPHLQTLLLTTPLLTPFRRRVLLALTHIPPGRTTTYGALAKHLGSSPRAVGTALRHNPFAPAVPCHRVVATSGAIGGFKGEWMLGGLVGEKVDLLRGEGVVVVDEVGGWRVKGGVWRAWGEGG